MEIITTAIIANVQKTWPRSLNIVAEIGPSWAKGGVVFVSFNKGGSTRDGQRGQGMVEYALILVLVSIVVIVILLTMGNQIQNVFSNVVAALG
jgi:pilus assembly protein Flp/PilA